ncbi:MAG TPA: DNA polymerase III subunit gamma/tau [Xanthomonadales bacterium]|nr:DNA polymerase III subunit gamma/tau [Xanthomonadales bacterium]
MSYQVLARKWRPKFFKELVGQEAVVRALVNGLDNDRVHHAFLFTGTRGVGKTTLARILAKCLNCETGVTSTPCGECGSCVDIDDGRFVDMLEIDAASRTGVEDMRELLEGVQFMPTRGRFKVYVIDEVHMLSTASFNALLKSLEEPPPHVKFVLATTDPNKIPVTILSRCLQFNLRRLLPAQIGDYLEKILASESIEAEASAVERIARAADGSMRDGLSLLDQAIAYGGGKLKDEDVAQMMGSVDHAHVAALIRSVARGEADRLLEIVAELFAQARNLESVLTELAEALHRVCLVQLAPGYEDPERSDWESIVQLAEVLTPEDAQLFYQIAIQGGRDLGIAPDPRTGLEMTLLRMLAFRPAQAPEIPKAKADEPQAVGTESSPAAAKSAASKGSPKAASAADGEDWHGLLPRLDLSGPVRELARNIQLESKSGDRWQFLIPDSVQHLGSASLVQKLQSALASQLGHPVSLALHTASEPVPTPAVLGEQATLEKLSDAERAIEQDPTVQALKERFGARLIEDSVQPLQ